MKKIITTVMAGLFLISAGAFAADKKDCKADQKWDATKKECVKK
jgi:uncharacterized protein YxeA